MNVLLDEQEVLIQRAAGEFLAAECTPALVRAAEKDPAGWSAALWKKFAALGWLGLCLPEQQGGQALPLHYLGLLFEELGRHIAPLPVHATLVPAMVIARHGSAQQRAQLAHVAAGERRLCFAVTEPSGRWSADAIGMSGRREGDDIVLSGTKHFVDGFRNAAQCLVAFRLQTGAGTSELAAILVDTDNPGLHGEALVPLAKDAQDRIRFDDVRVPATQQVGQGREAVDDLMDLASALLAAQMQGAARQAMETAVTYVSGRDAFGQPIGAFQAIQHMAADMVNGVDGTQLLVREALWRMGQGLPARVEVAQAKSFANEKCLMACRGAQQMHGGIGFIAEFDINLWYRRVAAWSMRCGSTYDLRRRIAAALLDMPGNVRLGMTQHLPRETLAA